MVSTGFREIWHFKLVLNEKQWVNLFSTSLDILQKNLNLLFAEQKKSEDLQSQ